MPNSDFTSRTQQLASWTYHFGIIACLLVSLFLPPSFHALSTTLAILGMVGITAAFSNKTPAMSVNQVIVYALLGVLASGYLCRALWNSPAVLLTLPAFLFLLLVTSLIVHVRLRRQNL